MAAAYHLVEEEAAYKCNIHPSKRRRYGICPLCLIDRLSALCPDCAHPLPCACNSLAPTSSSSSSASSSDTSDARISGEASFHRSAFPFFRSARFSGDRRCSKREGEEKRSIWSVLLMRQRSRREKVVDIEEMKIRRSKSVAASIMAENEMMMMMRCSTSSPSPSVRGKWYFPSPMKVFRQSKRSPLCRS